ncbi:TPA: hypothetical protein MXA64_000039 [Klebsiella quasipneumoniae]|nr:hypothetical protein [Klebsiella quasipneumoniae]
MVSSNINVLNDKRVECKSLLVNMKISDYLQLIESAYGKRGGIPFQRDALKTTSGRRIRERMIQDIIKGTVLPPLVIGVVVEKRVFDTLESIPSDELIDNLSHQWSEQLSIIDGMQRTTALLAAKDLSSEVNEHFVRVEFWIAGATNSLIYRMLVLNTGQVPWNIKRQLQVVYSPLILEMQKQVKFTRLFTLESQGRRTHGGEYRAEDLVETYLAFGLRKTEIDTQETLADEYSRLDIADAISNEKYQHFFYPILQQLTNLDIAFSRCDTPQTEDLGTTNKFSSGRNIFDSQPARIGFVVACAITVLGRIGMDRTEEESQRIIGKLVADCEGLISVLASKNADEIWDFLKLDVLSERVTGQRRSAIGRQERTFFEGAFKVLIDESFNVPSLEVCWRS